MARRLLLPAALVVVLILAPLLLASAQAPGTTVNVGWGGGGGDNSAHSFAGWGDWSSSSSSRCGAHAAWVSHFKGCPRGLFYAELNGKKMIAPGSTTPAPVDTPATGHAWVCLTDDKTVITVLSICDLNGYVASHHHFGGPDRDFPPPIVTIEPEEKPADPLGPPTSLPMVQPPIDIGGGGHFHHNTACRRLQKTSSPSDLIVVPGGPASWDELLMAMQRGDVYLNAHSMAHPEGEIRGNFEAC